MTKSIAMTDEVCKSVDLGVEVCKSVDIGDEVCSVLDENPCIRMNMSKGLINTRALARYIIRVRKLDSTIDAVISTIRRYELESHEALFEKAYEFISRAITISTKSPLADIALIKDTEIQGLLPELFSLIHYTQGDVLRIIQADEAIKVLVDEKNVEKVKNLFPKDKITKINENLGEVNIHMPEGGEEVLGILVVALNELAINGINVQGTMTCYPEVLWFVKDKDLLKAYNVLYRLMHPKDK